MRAGAEVRALLEAVKIGDETAFVVALRGVFDSVRGDREIAKIAE